MSYMSIYVLMKNKMLYVSKVNMKNTLLKENNNNNKMSYLSEVIIKNEFRKKNNDSFTYQPKLSYRVKFSGINRNGWNEAE